jgi:hypothetical protein
MAAGPPPAHGRAQAADEVHPTDRRPSGASPSARSADPGSIASSADGRPSGRSALRRRPAASSASAGRKVKSANRFGGGGRWRAILIPLLVIVTIVFIFQATSGRGESSDTAAAPPSSANTESRSPFITAGAAPATAAPPTAATANAAPTAAPADPAPGSAVADPSITDALGNPAAAAIPSGFLPAGAPFVAAGAGTWHVVPGTSAVAGTGARHSTYTVEVEDGLQTPEQDQAFAAEVDATLADPRSWIGGGQVSLSRIDTGDPDFRISLTSQLTIRTGEHCGFDVPLEASCFNGMSGQVLINDARWVRGALSYGSDIASYRAYAINHEVGHALGNGHQPCPGPGQPAPVMMQQSWSIANDDLSALNPDLIPHDGSVCVANPYPYPSAVAAAPVTAAAG